MTRTQTTVPLVERVVFLRKAPLFAGLPPQDLQPIAEVAEEHVFAEGELIAAEGEPGETTFVIVDGDVDVVADGRTLAVRGSGDSLERCRSSPAALVSRRCVRSPDVRVLEIHKPAFEAILRERPDTALALMRVFASGLPLTTPLRVMTRGFESIRGFPSTSRSRTMRRGSPAGGRRNEDDLRRGRSCATPGNTRRQIAPHGDRRVDVLLPVPQVHRRPDVLEAKCPRPSVEPHLPGRPAAPAAKRFGEALPEYLSYLRPVEVFLVHGGLTPLSGSAPARRDTDRATRAMRIRRKTPRFRTSWNANRFRRPMPAIAPGTLNGARLLTIPAFVSRSASFHAHAAAYGPPPEIPKTAKRSSPKVAATSTTSSGQSTRPRRG